MTDSKIKIKPAETTQPTRAMEVIEENRFLRRSHMQEAEAAKAKILSSKNHCANTRASKMAITSDALRTTGRLSKLKNNNPSIMPTDTATKGSIRRIAAKTARGSHLVRSLALSMA